MRGRRSVLVFVLFSCLFSVHLTYGEYGWPLPENYGVSATFGESRTDHFHAGIDLSTNGQIGVPVMAIADGKVMRLKIQKRGYGRALYIQHPDGVVSLYAHLDHYSSDLGLENIYQKKVAQNGTRYPGDIFLDPPISVHKGDVIAYSGETGAGRPHLHLELRKEDGTVAINPLLNGFKDTQDLTPPGFQALYLDPLNFSSEVNGDLESVEIRLKKKEDGSYGTSQVPVVRGEFVVSVSAYDETLRPYHRAPQRFVYAIDGKEIYSIEFTQLSYTQPSNFGLVYDLGKPGAAYYEWPVRLTNPSGIPLPFVIRSNAFSTAVLAPGTHGLEVSAVDANGNLSVAQVQFLVNRPPVLQIEGVQQAPNGWTTIVQVSDPDLTDSSSLSTTFEYSTDEGKTFRIAEQAAQESLIPDSVRLTYSIPPAPRGHRILIRARSFDGAEFSSYSVMALIPEGPVSAKAPAGQIRITPFNDRVKVSYETASIQTQIATLQYGIDSTLPMNRMDLSLSEVILPLPKISGSLAAKVDGAQASIPLNYLAAGVPGLVQNQSYSLSFYADSLYWDTFVWTRSLSGYQARLLPTIGPMLQLSPRGLPLKAKTTLNFNYPRTIYHPEKLSIYLWDRAGQKWTSLPSTVNRKTRSVQTGITFFDLYALMYDNVPPAVSSMIPRKRSRISNPNPTFSAVVRDRGMQVDDERIFFYVDGVAHRPDYDPDRDLATLSITQSLTHGAHSFRVIVSDYAGNKTYSPKITFYIR